MKNNITKNVQRDGELTTAPVTAPTASGATFKDAEFFRLPAPGTRNPLSGLSRTSILEYGENGNFKIIRLRKRGSKRGIVLVDTASFLRWLHGQPAVRKEEAR